MAEELRPEGIPVTVGEVVITTPGLTGEVEVHGPGTPGMRGEEQATEDFRQALDDAGMAEQLSVVVSRHQEVTPGEGTRGSGGGDDIVVNVPAPGEGNGQVLLYAAEDGSLSWHLADDVPPTAAPDRGGERRTYRIPRAVVPVDEREPAETRGILGAIGKKVLKVLVFPLVDPILGKVGDHFAKRWEAKNRLNRVRWMTVDGYRSSVADPFAAADWARLGEGRALVLVHGTFSTAHGAFGSLPPRHHDRAARGVRRPRRRPRPPQRLRHAEGERRAARRAGSGRRRPRGRPGHALTRRVWSVARSPGCRRPAPSPSPAW